MAMLKKKTRKAIKKSLKKIVNKHAPTVAEHLATALAAGMATYLGTEDKKGSKQIKKLAKNLPGGKHLARAVAGFAPALKDAAEKLPGHNGHRHSRKGSHSKKSASAS
jgi:hypothetical protein